MQKCEMQVSQQTYINRHNTIHKQTIRQIVIGLLTQIVFYEPLCSQTTLHVSALTKTRIGCRFTSISAVLRFFVTYDMKALRAISGLVVKQHCNITCKVCILACVSFSVVAKSIGQLRVWHPIASETGRSGSGMKEPIHLGSLGRCEIVSSSMAENDFRALLRLYETLL